MISDKNYIKILDILDSEFYGYKMDDTGFNYRGLTLDYLFDNSVFQIDYVDINDFFEKSGILEYNETKYLSEQYKNLDNDKKIKLIECIINLLNKSQNSDYKSIYRKIKILLTRDDIQVIEDFNYITLNDCTICGFGSYCVVRRIKKGVVLKELNSKYKKDEKQQKRIKYEYENMKKLSECDKILKVYDYDSNNHSYTMEEADITLFDYLEQNKYINFNFRIEICSNILEGLAYAHNKNIIHRDLHLGNILKVGDHFVISDFGWSKDLSKERSLKTSSTPKNGNYFMDPAANNNLKNMTVLSDIYAVGAIMDYVMSGPNNENHPFKHIFTRCTSRNIADRYKSVNNIIEEMQIVLKDIKNESNKEEMVNKIIKNKYDETVYNYINNLVKNNHLCRFIVKYKLRNIYTLFLKFDLNSQVSIVENIKSNYSESTGYSKWENYDIFADIAYNLFKISKNKRIKMICKNILKEISSIRYYAKNLYDELFIEEGVD